MNGSQPAYHLRVNKYIDRQLFLETLALVDRFRPVTQYGYVSMAGAYLEDCRVLHQTHRITRMYSFDENEKVLPRQRVNLPYGFIRCECHTSRHTVEQLDSIRAALGGADTNLILWLDYTSPKQRKAQLQELETLVSKLIDCDAVRVTFNANRATLGDRQVHQHLISSGMMDQSLHAWRHTKLQGQLGDSLPPERDNPAHMESEDGFCRTMLRAVKRAVLGALHPRSELIAFPLLSTVYNDQHHTMATTSFIILRADQQQTFEAAVRWGEWPNQPGPDWDNYLPIQVPHLSLRERFLLHNTISQGGQFSGDTPEFITEEELEQYRMHYHRYPTFAPLDMV